MCFVESISVKVVLTSADKVVVLMLVSEFILNAFFVVVFSIFLVDFVVVVAGTDGVFVVVAEIDELATTTKENASPLWVLRFAVQHTEFK